MPPSTQPVPGMPRKVNLSHAILTMLNTTHLAEPTEGRAAESGVCAVDAPGVRATVNAVAADIPADPSSDRSPDITIEDWDALFGAVEARLRMTVGEPLAAPTGAHAHDAAVGVQTIVLECVAALEQLHTALTHERGRREQL